MYEIEILNKITELKNLLVFRIKYYQIDKRVSEEKDRPFVIQSEGQRQKE